LGPDQAGLAIIAPGVLWLGALLACLLSLDRIFGLDYEDGTLDLLATSPLPPESVYIAKAAAHWLTTGLPLSLAAPVLGVLLNLDFETGKVLCLSLVLGTPALSLIGAFGASLTLGVKRGGLLLSLLAKLARRNGLEGLSMGMSDDFAKAISFGATHVRVGSAIFGARVQAPHP
ncbi:heme exporter protein CcmB, partial [bacterium]|nr:heme exporter protein CcmB [bacterium]